MATCGECGQRIPEKREHVVHVLIPRRGGYSKWERSIPMTRDEATTRMHELTAVGYKAKVEDIHEPLPGREYDATTGVE